MPIDAEAVGLVVDPVTIVYVAVRVDQPATPVGLVVLPPALVHRAVRPDLLAFAFTDFGARNPLSFKFCVVVQKLDVTDFQVSIQA